MRNTIYIVILSCVVSLLSCKKDIELTDAKTVCEQEIVLDSDKYKSSARGSEFNIRSAKIEGDCLSITISAGGCDGSTWEAVLYDSEAIAESLPVQRSIRFYLKDEELCRALITKTYSFDLKPARVSGENKIFFNLDGFNQGLFYSY